MDNRKEIINNLQIQANNVMELKKLHRLKRPIVIEFSGSPKSGKTSCINSLELFLKRNGFSVKTVQERASVCPVTDKLSPMFNIWTTCASLTGMLGTLEDKNNTIDVLILDRGIFDSLCWFDWLVKKGRMENEQREVMQSFLLMDELVKPIDIVFAFTVTPKESIDREFTHLLTDKFGTIMNETVLEEYRQSVIDMSDRMSGYFHKIFKIDTTEHDQNAVGKMVTEKTLDALRELLMEKIGYFERTSDLSEFIDKNEYFSFENIEPLLKNLNFGLREEVEDNNSYIQPIPVAVIVNKNKDKILVIKKNNNAVSKNSPEKDKTLVYIGGHMRYEDMTDITSNDLLSICRGTLKRELKEELGITVALKGKIPFAVYLGDSDRSYKHLAICFVIEIEESTKLRLDANELVQKRGRSKSGTFISLQELENMDNEFESWSKIILNKHFKLNISNNTQMYLKLEEE